MSRIITFSEAGSIAIHAIVLVGKAKEIINVNHIAEATGSSRHHVAKVMQMLVKDGFLKSTRGPRGGFVLKLPAGEITLLEIYEAIEGPIEITDCMMEYPVCPFDKCLMENLVKRMTIEIKEYLGNHTVKDYIEE